MIISLGAISLSWFCKQRERGGAEGGLGGREKVLVYLKGNGSSEEPYPPSGKQIDVGGKPFPF